MVAEASLPPQRPHMPFPSPCLPAPGQKKERGPTDTSFLVLPSLLQLGILLSQLKKIGEEFNVAVVLTNQVMADPGGMTFAGEAVRRCLCRLIGWPAGWRVWTGEDAFGADACTRCRLLR